MNLNRRKLLRNALASIPALAVGPSLLHFSVKAHSNSFHTNLKGVGNLLAPDENGVRLPAGFVSRVVAVSGQPVTNTRYVWHKSPDGGACFATPSGGWIYVSNCEEWSPFSGGASAIEFDKDGNIIAAREILKNTQYNCAGGATPWNTWLSCEEMDRGSVYEADPYGNLEAKERPALGYFQHEAVAIDPVNQILYMTEDEPDGCLYRFIPTGEFPDLSQGDLQVAVAENDYVRWVSVPNPTPALWQTRTRNQVPNAMRFRGGEGIWFENGFVFFTTKLDHRVWGLNTNSGELDVIYDGKQDPNKSLRGVDNITSNADGNLLVAEDGGDMQLVILAPDGTTKPFLQIVEQDKSEITGPAFSPDGSRLYFSSQRGMDQNERLGITYEVRAI